MDDDTPVPGVDARITRAIRFMRRVADVDSENRVNAKEWRKFRDGDQWPADIQNSRQLEQRPCITINKVDAYCQKVENQQRQQRPRIKVDPTGGRASKKDADVIKGMIRHVEATDGGADMAYDTGFSYAATEGRGYWRIMSRFVKDDGFEQELYLMQVDDPLSVYYDDNAIMPDGSDAQEVLIVADMAKDAFKRQYPNANDGASFVPDGYNNDWITKDRIRVAEHFYFKHDTRELCKLSDGTVAYRDMLPAQKVLDAAGVTIVGKRNVDVKTVEWCKLTALDVVEERTLPGKYIPVIPCYGRMTVIEGKRKYSGLVKNAVGPQTLSNFWKTAMTESVALAPKAKWVLAEGQDEDHELEWADANRSARSTLRYKPTMVNDQPAPPPQRVQPEPPPEGAMAMAALVDQDLSAVLGIVEPAMRVRGNVSGKALQAERLQSDENTFNFYDNMTRSIAFTGRQLVDLFPHYYPEPGRVVRIIGDDGKSKTQELNVKDDAGRVLFDMNVREYEIVMDTGPGYNTKRQEAVDSMMPLFEKDPELMKAAGDILFRNMDFPGAETIADRLAAANPLSQIDESSDIPPTVQTLIKGLQMKLQQAGQEIQGLQTEIKLKSGLQAQKEDAETRRTLMRETASIHRNEQDNAAWMHDIQTKSLTAMGVAELKGIVELIKNRLDREAENFHKIADREEAKEQAREDREAAQIQAHAESQTT